MNMQTAKRTPNPSVWCPIRVHVQVPSVRVSSTTRLSVVPSERVGAAASSSASIPVSQ